MAEYGPGWSWMWIYEPWRVEEEARPEFAKSVFPTFDQARTDALASGPMTMPAARELDSPSAFAVLGASRSSEELMLLYAMRKDAFAIYRVGANQEHSAAGMEFYLHWKHSVFPRLMATTRMPLDAAIWYGRNPAGSGGAPAGCLLSLMSAFLGATLIRSLASNSGLAIATPDVW